VTDLRRFDDELRRAARGLVMEELPRGVLDQEVLGTTGRGVISRRGAPGLAATVAAALILLTAAAIALAPATAPSPAASPTPVPTQTKAPFVEPFRSTDVIRGQLAKLGYSCNDGFPSSSVGPEADAVTREATVCTAPQSSGPFVMAVIVGEAANGKVVELTIKSDLVGTDDADSRAALAAGVAKVFSGAFVDEGAGQNGGSWAKVLLPQLERGDDIDVILRQVSFRASRLASSSYLIVARGAGATP
jgi:hypothetical protein